MHLLLGLIVYLLAGTVAMATPHRQLLDEEIYVVQADDRLGKIAEKYYRDAALSSLIIQATNAKALEDHTFAPLAQPNLLKIGQKLWIPPHNGVARPPVVSASNIPSLPQIAEIDMPADTLAVSPDDKLLALDSWDNDGERLVQVWDTETWGLLWANDMARYIAFSPNGQQLATVISNSTWLCQATTGAPQLQLPYEAVYEVEFSPDGQRLANAVGAGAGKVILWDVTNGQLMAEFKHNLPIWDFTLSPNGLWLTVMTAGSWGPVEPVVWDILTRERRTLAEIEGLSSYSNMVFSPDAKWLAANLGYEAPITIWATQTWLEVAQLERAPGFVTQLTFSPDGRWLAGVVSKGEMDNRILIWEVSTWRLVAQMHPADSVLDVAFSPDGQWLAAGLGSGIEHPPTFAGQLWQVATGELVAQMPHAGQVQAVAFSHNGQWIATGSVDRTVRIWAVP